MKKLILPSIFIFLSFISFAEHIGNNNFFVVDKNGCGDFQTIQAALDSIPANQENFFIIFINNGFYSDKLFLEKSNIIICGESRDKTIIEFAELRKNWKQNHENDFGSSVVNIKKM